MDKDEIAYPFYQAFGVEMQIGLSDDNCWRRDTNQTYNPLNEEATTM